MERQAEIVDRAGGARKVEDEVDRLVNLDVLDQVMIEEEESLVTDVLDVLERARVEVVDAKDAMSLLEEVLAQVRAQESGSPGYDGGRHDDYMLMPPLGKDNSSCGRVDLHEPPGSCFNRRRVRS
jgi:hypothetical protein